MRTYMLHGKLEHVAAACALLQPDQGLLYATAEQERGAGRRSDERPRPIRRERVAPRKRRERRARLVGTVDGRRIRIQPNEITICNGHPRFPGADPSRAQPSEVALG